MLKKEEDVLNVSPKKPNNRSNIGQLVFDALEKYFQQHHNSLPPPGLYKRVIDEVERPLLFLTLKAVSGNQQKAAKILGVNRNTLRKKIARLMKSREGAKALQNFAEEL
jgi:two-component system nitrogen regulation response regulator GlnG